MAKRPTGRPHRPVGGQGRHGALVVDAALHANRLIGYRSNDLMCRIRGNPCHVPSRRSN